MMDVTCLPEDYILKISSPDTDLVLEFRCVGDRCYCSRCKNWLYGHSDSAPNHLCHDIVRQSVEDFCSERRVICTGSDVNFAKEFPLPIGFGAMEKWAMDRQKPGVLPQPLVMQEDALLGLVAHRTPVPSCHVWLLGLVKIDEDAGGFRFGAPLIQIEGHPTIPQVDTLTRKAKQLLKWYNGVILGRSVVGRPIGSGYFEGVEDFLIEVKKAMDRVIKKKKSLTKKSVAMEMGRYDVKSLTTWCQQAGYPHWRALIADLERKRDSIQSVIAPSDG